MHRSLLFAERNPLISFDKGVGMCVMKKQTYHSKVDQKISLPQFENLFMARKNTKHPVFKEEENIILTLKDIICHFLPLYFVWN